MRRPAVHVVLSGRYDFKKADSTLERLLPGQRIWEPCTMTDLALACGWGARARVRNGEEATSAHGTRYRRRA